jgi:uncharacterized membrane protein YoaK (UPF0700 family)
MAPETTPQPSSLSDAVLLAGAGGLLDAMVYLNHGHVFANAMTGNVIFLAIAVLAHEWREVLPRVIPILGFFAGVITSRHLRSRHSHAAIMGLAFEIVTLFALGWLPLSFPSMAFTGIIAFVAALQVASFRRVDRFAFNSTFVTGNLRDAIEGLYDTFAPSTNAEVREKGRAQAIDLGLICLCFLAGAVTGAWAAPRFGNRTLWLTEPLLLAVFIRLLRGSTK